MPSIRLAQHILWMLACPWKKACQSRFAEPAGFTRWLELVWCVGNWDILPYSPCGLQIWFGLCDAGILPWAGGKRRQFIFDRHFFQTTRRQRFSQAPWTPRQFCRLLITQNFLARCVLSCSYGWRTRDVGERLGLPSLSRRSQFVVQLPYSIFDLNSRDIFRLHVRWQRPGRSEYWGWPCRGRGYACHRKGILRCDERAQGVPRSEGSV